MRVKVSRAALAHNPYLVWNAFCEFACFEEVEPAQAPAHLVFWYDAEVANGGHLQYFENSAGANAEQAIEALEGFGLRAHATILRAALGAHRKLTLAIESKSDFIDEAVDGPWLQFDRQLWAARPDLGKFLQAHVAERPELYVEFVP